MSSAGGDLNAGPDLDVLRRNDPAPPRRRRSPVLARLTLLVVVLGLMGLVYALVEPLLFPPRVVRLAAVRQAGPQGDAGTVAVGATQVEAAGWIEAFPYPVSVRPLVMGVVSELRVLEGHRVEKDKTVIGVLRNLELENALEQARSERALRAAQLGEARVELSVAISLHEQRLAERMQLAARHGAAQTAASSVRAAKASQQAAEAELSEAGVDLGAQEDLARAGGNAPAALLRARAREAAARARLDAAGAVLDVTRRELERAQAELGVAQEAVDDPRDLAGAQRIAEARVLAMESEVARAETAVAIAERNVAHLMVRAPCDGLVMRVDCAPGAMAGPVGDFKGEAEGRGSTGLLNRATGVLATIYDPTRLQVRVDVPYVDVVGIQPGDPVELEPHALPGQRLAGRVDRLVHEADINKAMLQVKVSIDQPDGRLRPEMLVKARFVKRAAGVPMAGGGSQFLVPKDALRVDAVFVLDPRSGGRARRIPVRVISTSDESAVIQGELGLSSKVILDAVEDGERVKGDVQ